MNGDQSLPADFRGIIEECAHRATEEGVDGAPEWERFRVISDKVGIFLFILARSTWRTRIVDMGGRGGAASSIVWLAGAACQIDGEVTAWETNPRRLLKLQNCLSRARLSPNVEIYSADPMWFVDEERSEASAVEADFVVASLAESDWPQRITRGWDLLETDGLLVLTDTLQAGESAEVELEEFFASRMASTVSFGLGEGVLLATKHGEDSWENASSPDAAVLGETACRVLEELQRENRKPGSRLWAIPPATGRFIRMLVRAMDAKRVLEIGASGGYSGTWIAKALEVTGGHLVTMDLDPEKVALARETYESAGIGHLVEIHEGDALEIVPTLEGAFDLVFLDCSKEYYVDLLEPILWRLRRGGLLIADNVISHEDKLKQYVDLVQHHPSLASVTVPIGSGEELTMVL